VSYDGKQQKFFVDGHLLWVNAVPKPGPLLESKNLTLLHHNNDAERKKGEWIGSSVCCATPYVSVPLGPASALSDPVELFHLAFANSLPVPPDVNCGAAAMPPETACFLA
jgi:hypothetical protein